MKKTKYFSINQNIEVALAGDEHFFKTIIYEIDADTLLIAMPTHKGKRFLPQVGEAVTGRFPEGSALFVFETTVLERTVMDNHPLLRLRKPSTLTRKQRRDFFRYPVILNLEYSQFLSEKVYSSRRKNKPDKYSREKATTLDIGGGGLRFASKKKIAHNTLLRVKLELKAEGGPDFVSAIGRVVRVIPPINSGEPYIYGVKFDEIKEIQRDKVINYIFTVMRRRAT